MDEGDALGAVPDIYIQPQKNQKTNETFNYLLIDLQQNEEAKLSHFTNGDINCVLKKSLLVLSIIFVIPLPCSIPI